MTRGIYFYWISKQAGRIFSWRVFLLSILPLSSRVWSKFEPPNRLNGLHFSATLPACKCLNYRRRYFPWQKDGVVDTGRWWTRNRMRAKIKEAVVGSFGSRGLCRESLFVPLNGDRGNRMSWLIMHGLVSYKMKREKIRLVDMVKENLIIFD